MQIVRVRLRKPARVHLFACNGVPLKRNDPCIVRTDRGLEYGTCVLPPEDCPDDARDRPRMTVVRRVTQSDEENLERICLEEEKARKVCVRRIKERDLNMKLVDVEYTFDKHRVVFYFTAADRVDFRQLVRDLAQDLKTRIELRHIQVRDEAKLVGGLGVCGRELCCATWLCEFKPISMKMAKRQNLSLNPSKISGQCGRLLCCLEYENDLYEDPKKRKRKAAQAQQAAPPCADGAQPHPCPMRDGEAAANAELVAEGKPDEKGAGGPSSDAQGGAPSRDPEGQSAAGAEGTGDKPRRRPRRRRGRRRRKKPGSGQNPPKDSP